MAVGDPPTPDYQQPASQDFRWPSSRNYQWPARLQEGQQPTGDEDEQWFFQFHEHLQLTVQAIHRLHQALSARML